jgi:hypothetical protein
VAEVRETLAWIVNNADRARAVVDRIAEFPAL